MPLPQTLTHHLPTEVEIAVLEADFLANLLIQLKWQRLRAVEELQLPRKQLHTARSEIGVHRPRRTLANASFNPDDELIAQPLRLAEELRRVGIEYHLQQPLAIAQ